MSSTAPGPRAPPITPTELGIGRLFDAIRDAVVVSDAQGAIVLWNKGAEEIFGHTAEEACGLNVSILVPERYREQHDRGMARYARTGHGPLIDSHTPVELPAIRKDGSEISVELTLAPVEEKGHRYALALLRDVTERVRLREDLERRNAEAEEANRALARANDSLTAFSYVVSHDLKEPVRAIHAYLDGLLEDHAPKLSEEARDLVEQAHISTRRLGALLSGLLELSRLDRMLTDPETLSLSEVLESDACRGAYENLVRERDVIMEVQDVPPVRGASAVMCQILGNLVTNAIRHNPSPAPRVRIRGSRQGDQVEILVEDNGPGFPRQVMEGFASGARESVRAGFGLLIARRAIERLGGRMALGASEDLGGAAVRMTLPAANED